jgi:polar amino acid transport system substrate-binding protein
MYALPGCGLVYDAVRYVVPVASDELETICRRQRVQVGMGLEPFRPFVFPAIWTDEGARVTGLDVELVRQITASLSRHCGTPVTPVLHLVRFRDLFLLLSEGRLDLVVSAVAANTPSPARAGFAYSLPYFEQGGISGITSRQDVVELVRANLRAQAEDPPYDGLTANQRALAGLTIAVQEGTTAHAYAKENLRENPLVLCDSLPAAFEAEQKSAELPIDVILGGQPILQFMVKRVHPEWQPLIRDDGTPFLLTKGQYAVVMPEDGYHLRWFVNDLIFRLEQAGTLRDMRRRWIDEDYAFPRRASAEGLPFDVEKMVAHYTQGTCRGASR